MKKLLLFLISLCGVLPGCHRMPTTLDVYDPTYSNSPPIDTIPEPDPDSTQIRRPDPGEYKLLYGVRPTPFEEKKMAEDSLKNAKQ